MAGHMIKTVTVNFKVNLTHSALQPGTHSETKELDNDLTPMEFIFPLQNS